MKTLGRLEWVLLQRINGKKWTKFKAKMDTGASWSRIGLREAAELKLGPIEDARRINTSGGGSELRPVVPATIRIGDRQMRILFTISAKKKGVLIGRRTMRNKFSVDPAKRYVSSP